MQGHVDAVAEVADVREDGIAAVVAFRVPEGLERYLVEKGSVAVAGVSLTVSALAGDGFEVWLIPHTREVTTLGGWPREAASTSRWTSWRSTSSASWPTGSEPWKDRLQ